MRVSTTAVATTAGVPETSPKVRVSTVRMTSGSAGEAPGEVFEHPEAENDQAEADPQRGDAVRGQP